MGDENFLATVLSGSQIEHGLSLLPSLPDKRVITREGTDLFADVLCDEVFDGFAHGLLVEDGSDCAAPCNTRARCNTRDGVTPEVM